MAKDVWSPDQYGRFKEERSRPFYDLLELVRPGPSPRLLDLGCGTAELTASAHRRLGAYRTLGVDRSEAMLEKGRALGLPALELVHADIAEWIGSAPGRFDVILSNAALHWVPRHDQLFPRLVEMLSPGGQLAVQVPVNHEQPPRRVADALAAEPPFAAVLGSPPPVHVLGLEEYARLLHRAGLAEQVVRAQVYVHTLESRDDVVEWVKGTTLTWIEERLPPELWARYVAEYRRRLQAELPDERPFLVTFRRLFLWGKR